MSSKSVLSWVVLSCLIVILLGFDDVEDYLNDEQSDEQFRTASALQAWKAARLILSETDLIDFRTRLRVADDMLIQAKDIAIEGNAKEEAKEISEQKAKEKFASLLREYNITSVVMDDTLTHEIADLERRGAILDNAELLKLWKAITKGGLHTSDDLEFFWKELLSLKEELDKLHTIREKLKATQHKPGKERSPESQSKLEVLTDHQKFVNEHLKQLSDKAAGKVDLHDPRSRFDNFSDDHIKNLWKMAKNSQLTENELKQFKTDFEEFQRRLSRHKELVEQISKSTESTGGRKEEASHKTKKAKSMIAQSKDWLLKLYHSLVGRLHKDEL